MRKMVFISFLLFFSNFSFSESSRVSVPYLKVFTTGFLIKEKFENKFYENELEIEPISIKKTSEFIESKEVVILNKENLSKKEPIIEIKNNTNQNKIVVESHSKIIPDDQQKIFDPEEILIFFQHPKNK